MELYLMRHGRAVPKVQDAEEGLSQEGAKEVIKAAKGLKALGVSPEIFISSPKKRAVETAKLVIKELGGTPDDLIVSETFTPLSPPEESLRFLREHIQGGKRILIAGHLPSLALITGLLVAKTLELKIDFGNGGVACIGLKDFKPGYGALVWAMDANALAMLA